MTRVMLALVCSLPLLATPTFAQNADEHPHGGVGFHDIAAPVALRWWFSGEQAALDVGVGFGSDPAGIDPNEKVGHFALDAGVPFVIRSWPGVHVLFRPGFLYTNQQVGFDRDPGIGFIFDTDAATTMSVRAELEGEVFLRDNITVSASHGIEFVTAQAANTNPGAPDPQSRSSFGTIGRQITQLGFHMYFLGNRGNHQHH